MAEKKKEAQSLNQRHNRLLLDLSASHSTCKPKPPSRMAPMGGYGIEENVKVESKVKLEGRRRLYKASSTEDDVPQFSGIADFDSPSPVEMKPSKVEIGGHKLFGRGDDDCENRPTFNGLKFSGIITDFDSQLPVPEKPPQAIADFDSPPPVKNVMESSNGGCNEIQDILNDLSSRLEILSIEKTRVPKTIELLDCDTENSNQPRVRSGVNTMENECENENGLPNDSEGDNFLGSVNKIKNFGERQKQNEATRVGGETISTGPSFGSNFVRQEEDNDNDDCVVTSGQAFLKEVQRRHGKFRLESNNSDEVDKLDDYADDSVQGDKISIVLSGPSSTYRLPGKIAKMLYPHQRDGMKWLWSLHCQGKGGILGDDMGLGKTMQICGFLAGLFHSCLIKRALVVAPKTLLPHWIKELSVVGLSEKTREYFGTCAKARQYELQYILQDKGVLLTTYDIVRNNARSLRGDCYFHDERSEDIKWDYMILDEGHLIKNPSTQRSKSLLEIPSAHRIIISGTPIQNNLKELWALFNFCCPELLGDKNWFKEKYESAILRGNDKNASDRDKRIGSAIAKELRERIQPYFLRRLKSEVFREDGNTDTVKLSKKNEIIVWLRLTNCQRQLYEAFLKSELVLSAFDGSPLAALTILKKICDHPLLLTKRAAEDVLEGLDSMLNQEDHGVAEKLAMHIADVTERLDFGEKHDNVSCKISFILSLLDNLILDGHFVLIFSQTRKMLNLIQESLVSEGYKFSRIDGTTKASDRVKIVNDFQEGNGGPIFLLTSQVGGLGLTLTKADRVIVVDPAWNPSTDNQSVDRAYRIGQKKDVIVYRLMTCGTVEEKIYRKQIYKGGLFKSATEHKEQIRYFSQQDLRELFSLPKHGFDISLTQQQLHEEHDHQHTMDEYLTSQIKFLETLGIAGVSHHSLLFSKTAPVPVVPEEEIIRVKQTTFVGNPSSSYSSIERSIDGAEYAFNPKDVKLQRKSSSPDNGSKQTEVEIKDRIKRLSQVLANKVMVSNLPDKGERIQKQIAELNSELDKIQMEKRGENEIIHLDDLVEELQRVLNV